MAVELNASPMRAPGLHDTFSLIDGSKTIVFPGIARVTASLAPNLDKVDVPGEGEEQANKSEASGELKVSLIMTTDEQWRQYQGILTVLRVNSTGAPAVFQCSHPEARTRRIKRLYFQNEQLDAPYSPKDGYRVTLTFVERLRKKQEVKITVNSGSSLSTGQAGANGGFGSAGSMSDKEKAVQDSALRNLVGPPGTTRSGVNASFPGYCSGWTWKAYTEALGKDQGKLFGATANETEGRFRAAKQFMPYSLSAQQNLQPGDLVFYPPTKSVPQGHVGIYMGMKDGVPQVAGNNYITYQKRGGVFANGRATGYDRNGRPVDARGVEPMMSLGRPSGFGKPDKTPAYGTQQGPALPGTPPKPKPVPANAPSRTPITPPKP